MSTLDRRLVALAQKVNLRLQQLDSSVAPGLFTSLANGLAPASGGGTVNFLRADGSWAAPAGGGGGSSGVSSFNARTGAVVLTSGDVTGALGFTPQTAGSYVVTSNNLSDLSSAAAARTNLGLGTAATHPATDFQAAGSYLTANQTITLSGDATGSGTTAITVTIGANKVTRGMLAATAGATILGATAAGNVADLTAAQAKTFLAITTGDVSGLGSAASQSTATFAQTANNLSDLGSASTARTNLGLKTGALVNISVGTVAPGSPATNDLWVDTN